LQFQPQVPDAAWSWLLVLLLPVAFKYSHFRPILMPCIGFLWAVLHAQVQVHDTLSPSLEGRDLILSGEVKSLPVYDDQHVTFEFTIKKLWNIDALGVKLESPNFYPSKVRLQWYNGDNILQPGQSWLLLVRLKRPHGNLNPGGFDREQWLFKKGIGATGYVLEHRGKRGKRLAAALPELPLNRPFATSPRFGLDTVRDRLRRSIMNAVETSPNKGLLGALTLGDRQYISPEQWQVLTATGTNHLMAISGLHIGMVAGLLFFLGRWLWVYIPRAPLRFPAAKAGALLALPGACIYAALAGFSIPTQRALIMVAVVMLVLLLQRQVKGSTVLALALIFVLGLDPMAAMDVGFWLSFSAVALILFASGGRLKTQGWWWRWGRLQFVLFLGLFPILLIIYGKLSLSSPVANTLAIPVVSFVTVPLALSGTLFIEVFPAFGALLLEGADLSLSLLWWGLSRLADWDALQLQFFSPPGWTLVPAILGLLWMLMPAGIPARLLGIFWFLPMLMIRPESPQSGQFYFTLLDVGQGLAAVVQTRHHVLLFDTGPRFRSGHNTGESVVLPYLRHQGLNHLDRLIISHTDTDHVGGAESVSKSVPVSELLSGEPELLTGIKAAAVAPCNAGESWIWDDVSFTILHPTDQWRRQVKENNNLSCVLRVSSADGGRVLIPGDIEKAAEDWLVATRSGELRADVLVAPHHGSNTSSSAGFLDAVAPQVVVLPVGFRNRYGFPKAEVLQRYRQRDMQLYDSAQHGAIRFRSESGGMVLDQAYRLSQQRYWHSNIRNWYSFW